MRINLVLILDNGSFDLDFNGRSFAKLLLHTKHQFSKLRCNFIRVIKGKVVKLHLSAHLPLVYRDGSASQLRIFSNDWTSTTPVAVLANVHSSSTKAPSWVN